MSEPFQYDVFLSHSFNDNPVVRDVAERLRKDGLQTVTQLSILSSQLRSGTLNKERRFIPLCRGGATEEYAKEWCSPTETIYEKEAR